MSLSKYAYLNAKIGGMRSHLLSIGELKSIAEAQNYEECISLLKNTPYGKEIVKLSSTPIRMVENALTKILIQDYEKIIKPLYGDVRILLEDIEKKFEVVALKTIIEMKIAKLPQKEVKLYPWILTKIITEPLLEKMLQLETVDALVEALEFTEYYPALQNALTEYKEKNTPAPFITALDIYLYSKIGEDIERIKGRDKAIAMLVLGTEIDARNIVIALRSRGMPEEVAWKNFIPYRYSLKDSLLKTILNAPNLNQLISGTPEFRYAKTVSYAIREYEKTSESLPYHLPYMPFVAEAIEEYEKTESFLPFELALRRYMLSLSKKLFFGDRFHIGVPLAYLNLRDNEIKNLIAILKAKEVGLSSLQIEGLLVY